ncbi:MAG: adenylate/guanylate cyclase domain-containing protein [Acidimicrobiia bacterium]|nr:adenylate/guanylate cyclase domain-containing protein [Acidimicrobiia bacterium]
MKSTRHTRFFKPIVVLGIALAVTAVSWAGLSADVFYGTQLRFSDALFPGADADGRIVIVAIDDESIARVGRWPWSRSVHADLVSAMSADGAALIGYDVTFASPSTDDPESDIAFANAIAEAGNVVLAQTVTFPAAPPGDLLIAEHSFPPVAAFGAAAAGVGHANTFPDTDGVVRALPPVVELLDGSMLSSLSFTLAQLATGQTGPITVLPDAVQAGSLQVPTGDVHLLELNFAAGYPVIPAADILDGLVPAGTFEGRIVLVGATALGLGDLVPTPLDKAGRQAGVLVHANALNTILTDRFIRHEPTGATLAFVFIVALLLAMATLYVRPWLAAVFGAVLLAGFLTLVFRRFDTGVVMNMVYPMFAPPIAFVSGLGVRYFTEVRERKYVTNVFGRYLAKDVVAEVLASPEGAVASLSGASTPLAVLFADLRGFTAASEKATPPDVVAALNEYLEAMTRAVIEERGTIDKFMGDCVMAFWGAPRPDPEMVVRSVRAALKMQDLIDVAMATGRAGELKVKGCGVGLSFGEAVVGNIGSHERLDYTAIGDTVNTASRVCGVAEGGDIVVTEEFAAALPPGEFRLAELPPLKVKGKEALLRVYQVLRPGQEPKVFAADAVTSAGDEKHHFEPVAAPPKVAGYAPVEPRPVAPGTDPAS